MTAAELIERLKAFPPNSRVVYESDVISVVLTDATLYTWKDGSTDVELS